MARLARIVLAVASPLAVLACWLGGAVGILVFVVVTPLFPVALIALGATSERGGSRLALVLLALLLLLEAGSIGVLYSSHVDGNGGTVLGLPPGTVLMGVLLGFGPLLLIPASYALTFDSAPRDTPGEASDPPEAGPDEALRRS